MSGHEARINDALKSLGEEFRLGMVAGDEYRKRRRMILESWHERDATTSPHAVRNLTTAQPAAPSPSLARTTVVPPPSPKRKPVGLAVAAVAIVLVVAGGWYAKSRRAEPAAGADAKAQVEPPSPEVLQIKKSADEFLARNNWDAGAIDEFLAQWATLPAEQRARALQEPSLRTLRHELDENLRAESQLVAADAPPDQRRRLDALSRFARELGN